MVTTDEFGTTARPRTTPDRAVVFDLHGTLALEESVTPYRLAALPGAAAAIRTVQRRGWRAAVVTNQAWVSTGEATMAEIETAMSDLFVALDVRLIGWEICGHADRDRCRRRKPRPGMLLDLASRLRLDLGRSWFVGDRSSDVEAGRAAGCRTVLIGSGQSAAADLVAVDALGAAKAILAWPDV